MNGQVTKSFRWWMPVLALGTAVGLGGVAFGHGGPPDHQRGQRMEHHGRGGDHGPKNEEHRREKSGDDDRGGGRGGDHARSPEERREFFADRLADRVEATPEQRTQIAALLEAQAPEAEAAKATKQALHTELQAVLAAPTLDAAKLADLRARSIDLAEQRFAARFDTKVAIAQVLTPDQRAKLAHAEPGE